MRTRNSYEYAYLRVVPRVQMGEFRNVGVIVYSRTLRFLGLRIAYDAQALAAFIAPLPLPALEEQLAMIEAIARGQGPIGALGQAEIFRWLAAPHSTVMQASPVHTGLSDDPAAALDALVAEMTRAPHAPLPTVHPNRGASSPVHPDDPPDPAR